MTYRNVLTAPYGAIRRLDRRTAVANPVTTAERQVTHAGETLLSAKELELLMHAYAGGHVQFPLGQD